MTVSRKPSDTKKAIGRQTPERGPRLSTRELPDWLTAKALLKPSSKKTRTPTPAKKARGSRLAARELPKKKVVKKRPATAVKKKVAKKRPVAAFKKKVAKKRPVVAVKKKTAKKRPSAKPRTGHQPKAQRPKPPPKAREWPSAKPRKKTAAKAVPLPTRTPAHEEVPPSSRPVRGKMPSLGEPLTMLPESFMPIRVVGEALEDFVKSKGHERSITGSVFHQLKISFRNAWGVRKWKKWFRWIVDEYMLEDYIFDYEALRDT